MTMLQKVLTFWQPVCVFHIIIPMMKTKLFSDVYFSKTVLSM